MKEAKKKIKVFEMFAGIGAQHKAIKNIKKENDFFDIVKISEWDARAVISYANIHYKFDVNKVLHENNINSEEDIDKWLLKKTFSLDSKSPSKIISKSLEFKKNLVASSIVSNNSPNIKEVKGSEINGIDLITYSFPCQGLSIANMGRARGIKKDSNSTSNLIWQIDRILNEAKKNKQKLPKYLLLENVTQLLSSKHIDDYNNWTKMLKRKYNYQTFTFMDLIASDFGMAQKRKRVYAISILNPSRKWTIDELNKKIDTFKNKKDCYTKWINENIKLFPTTKHEEIEFLLSTPNKTPSRVKMSKTNIDLTKRDNKFLSTLTTKQDRHPNIGMIDFQSGNKKLLNKRFITPREAYKIMGFSNEDFNKIRKLWIEKNILTKESLYRQAGNSIAIKVLEALFKLIVFIDKKENHE